MRTHGERSRHRRSVQLEFLENRSLLSQLPVIGPTAEVRPAEVRHDVPYQDSGTGEVKTLGSNEDGTVFTQTYKTDGVATLLGRYTAEGEHDFWYTGDPAKRTGVVIGGFTSTTENGSTIKGTYSGTFGPDVENGEVVGVVFTIHIDLGKGTGRLAGVTGTTTMVAKAAGPYPGTPFTFTSEGTLTLPGRP